MITRSKTKNGSAPPDNTNDELNIDPLNDIDENGNISNLIDYNCNSEVDETLLRHEINKLRRPIQKHRRKHKNEMNTNGLDLMAACIMMNLLSQPMNESPSKKRKKKSDKKIQDFIQEIKENTSEDITLDEAESDSSYTPSDLDSIHEEHTDSEESLSDQDDQDDQDDQEDQEDLDDQEDEEYTPNGDETTDEEEYLTGDEEEDKSDKSDESEEESIEEWEPDELDEKYIDIIEETENIEDEEQDLNYFHLLTSGEKEKHICELKEINELTKTNTPLRFKVLNSNMELRTKSIAINNISKLNEMDISTGEYFKMEKWINGLISLPFGKYSNLPITYENTLEEKRSYLYETHKILNQAIYGHDEAKMHILQVIGKWIQNPNSHGNVLAIEGPMGNGKTTLVKEGIAKAINRPFAFIALGGTSDSSYFNGHSYTYEGSHWGRILDILIESKSMNPIIYFDELDKVSETHKGEEIIHLLTHLTDPSQNSLFQDNYFPGIHIDLSKCLFVFSFNNAAKVDPILKDRMYVINTKGFEPKEKIEICRNYILPELFETYLFTNKEIIFTDESLLLIIEKYTSKEEGVRNLKRCLETIISKVNIYYLSQNSPKEDNKEKIPLTFEIKGFQLPLSIDSNIVDTLLKISTHDSTPQHMYM
jgi:ATP-dependent Lon protease